MFQKWFTFGGALVLTAVLALATAGPSQAAGHFGGAHFGGAHFGGARFGGARFGGARFGGARFGGFNPAFHGGFYHGGYGYHPYGGYGLYSYPYYGYYPYSSSSGYDGSGYSESLDAYSPGVTADGFTAVSPLSGGASAPSGQADNTALLTVTVPAGADVWLDGSKTSSAGPVRKFQSPPLTPGSQYTYTVRASWNDNGHEVTQTQQVGVTAGAHVSVSFPTPAKTAGRNSDAKTD